MNDNSLLASTAAAQRAYFEAFGEKLRQLSREGQGPLALLLTCADARIMPELMFGLEPGQFFVHRCVANIIPPYAQLEISIGATLEYALFELQVPHIIVMGHIGCGGIYALDENISLTRFPALWRWLQLARPARLEVDAGTANRRTPEQRHQAIVEANVHLQIDRLLGYPFIRQAVQNNQLALLRWVYNMPENYVYALEDPGAQEKENK